MLDDLVRSVIVKILYSVEGGDVERSNLEINHRVCDCLLYSLFACTLILFTYLQVFLVL